MSPRGDYRAACEGMRALRRRFTPDNRRVSVDGEISVEDPRGEDIRALLAIHLTFARSSSPRLDAHALDIDGLLDPAVTFFCLRRHGALQGVAALKRLSATHAEVKSMHTAQASRGQGVGLALVEHLIDVARGRGFARLSLETGSQPAFAPARALYARAGFRPCPPFADYRLSAASTYLTLSLAPPAS